MVFWIAILVGGVFVWLAVRMGFYQSWALLFNIVISIYLAIFLAPAVTEWAPTSGGGAGYGMMLSMAVLAVGCFALLYGLSYVFLTGQFEIPFPKVLDVLVAGLLGFVAGFLVLSFAALLVTVSPLAQHKVFTTLGFSREAQKPNIACMAYCCDIIHSVARLEPSDDATTKAIDRLLDHAKPTPREVDDEPNASQQPVISPRAPRLPLDDL